MSEKEIRVLKEHLNQSMSYLEFGAGYSTILCSESQTIQMAVSVDITIGVSQRRNITTPHVESQRRLRELEALLLDRVEFLRGQPLSARDPIAVGDQRFDHGDVRIGV